MIGSVLVDIASGLKIKEWRNSFTVRAQEIRTRERVVPFLYLWHGVALQSIYEALKRKT